MKPKVLFILHIPPPVNGAAMVGNFIKQSSLINKEFEADYINLTTSFILDEIGKGGAGKLLTVLKIQYAVMRALLRKNYDLCYMSFTSHGFGFYKDLCIVALLKLFRKNIVFHFHNKGVALGSRGKINRFLYRFAFHNTQIILLSPHLYFDIAAYVKPEDVYFCANGIPKIAGAAALSEEQKPQGPCKLLFLSHMMADKGVLDLMEASKLLKSKGLNFECHFVGGWADVTQAGFNQIVQEKGLEGIVFAHGKRYGEEKSVFLKDADVFVLPTHNDCFPLVLLEAMQYSLPLVATPQGGIPDIVVDGENGLLVPQQDAAVLAEKLALLIQNPLHRQQMGFAGRKRYEQHYTLDKFESNFSRTLQQAVAHE